MKYMILKKLLKSGIKERIIICIASIIFIYLVISLFFSNHYFFNTIINGVDVSLKSYGKVDQKIINYITDYELKLMERDGESELITGQEISMEYNKNNSISKIYKMQKSLQWISSMFNEQKYYVEDLYIYNIDNLINRINKLNCVTKEFIEPQNVGFRYSNGSYELINEVYGNKIIFDKLVKAIKINVLKGKTDLNLDENQCYENPKYTTKSGKTQKTKNVLNKYVSVKITYLFGSENEVLDGATVNQWLSVDTNLEVSISKKAVKEYVKALSKKYNTVGIKRQFKASIGKTIEVKGGLYGWKINQEAETEALIENIKSGDRIEKEPAYTQKALARGENEIGNTYVEINITRQHLWYYKDGKLIAHGSVVTGNPNRGNATVTGVYMLNYKQNGATLKGVDYEVEVKYWMPFYGNMGIHDAKWRHSFGGEIYKSRGTHGCVNAPFYLAKKIFENIEEGIPVVSYEE